MISASSHLPYGSSPPAHWKVLPLKYLSTLSNGFAFKSNSWEDSGTPILRIENLNGSNRFNYSTLTLDDRYKVTSGDLLYSWSGNPGTSFGPFRWAKDGSYYLNQHIFKVSVQGCDTGWLYWSLRAATHWIERELTSGMIGMVHVTKDELERVPIPLPPPEEQRRIADFLDAETARIDRILNLKNSVQMQLVERVRSVRDGLVNGLAGSEASVPLRRFITRIEQGASPQCEASPREGEEEWAVLKLSSVKKGTFRPGENKRLPSDGQFSSMNEVRAGDLLVTRANTPSLVGDVAVVGEKPPSRLLLPDLIYRVGLTGEINAEYVAQVALSGRIRSLIESVARGTSQSMVKLRGEDIKEWPIPITTLPRQAKVVKEIAEAADTATSLQRITERQIKLLAERRQALITAAVTGQIDVSTASGRGIEE
jgi:type I restriction enzyme S subunit